jgi:5-methylthioadenosine/S-adenosylhomocysteine deaminase
LEKVDIIISGCLIVTVNKNFDVFPQGSIAIKNNQIVAVGPQVAVEKEYQANQVIDGKDKLALPGLINTHTHAAMVYFRGLADDLPLKEWLEKHIWPAEARFVSEKFIRQAIKLAALEMLKSGTTAFCDMYFAEHAAAEELEEIGLRAFLGEGVLDFPTPVSKTPQESLKKIKRLAEEWKDHEIIRPVVAPHAPYTCSEKTLNDSLALALEYQLPLHIHVAEEAWEVEKFKSEKGQTPVQYLDSIDFLTPLTSLAHANWLSDEDIEIIKARESGICHCPQSNMKLATGVLPLPNLLKKDVKVGLGTDGASSNNNLDMVEEMATAARLHKITQRDPTVVTAKQIIRAATLGGAEVLGVADELGSLELGKKADLVLINLNQPHLVPLYEPHSHLTYAAKGSDVETVIINGQIVVDKGDAITIDETKVLAEAKEFAQKSNLANLHLSLF